MNEEEELKEELERYERQNQEAYDKEVSGENFLRDRAKKKEEEEEKQEPDPDEGIAGADFTFEQALLSVPLPDLSFLLLLVFYEASRYL